MRAVGVGGTIAKRHRNTRRPWKFDYRNITVLLANCESLFGITKLEYQRPTKMNQAINGDGTKRGIESFVVSQRVCSRKGYEKKGNVPEYPQKRERAETCQLSSITLTMLGMLYNSCYIGEDVGSSALFIKDLGG